MVVEDSTTSFFFLFLPPPFFFFGSSWSLVSSDVRHVGSVVPQNTRWCVIRGRCQFRAVSLERRRKVVVFLPPLELVLPVLAQRLGTILHCAAHAVHHHIQIRPHVFIVPVRCRSGSPVHPSHFFFRTFQQRTT